MRRFVLGTAGHVDHGKTSLVRALTGRDTDRLPEEKRRGITIELGFAPWDLGGGVHASLIDVPGHRRLVHAMIAGAGGMELVILVVAADEGVMPQTREHVAVCELLGVRRAVIAVSKVDAVDPELAQLAGDEARALLGERWSAEVVRCSAKTGEGLEALGAAVRRSLDGAPERTEGGRARMAVDRVFTVRGAGTVVTGTLIGGRIKTGAPLFVVGERGRRETHARTLQVHDVTVDVAEGPTRLAVNLAGVALEDVKRGDVLTDDDALKTAELVDVAVEGVDMTAHELPRGAAATLYVGTARATVSVLRAERAETGGNAIARLRLATPLAIAGGDRYVLRGSNVDGPSGAILGGGVVLDAAPGRVRSRTRWKRVLQAVSAADAQETVRALVDERAPRPLERAPLMGRFALGAAAIARAADLLAEKKDLTRLGERAWVDTKALSALAVRARELVEEHARAFPLDRGLPLETLRAKLGRAAGRDAAERAIELAKAGPQAIAIDADVAQLRKSPLDARQTKRLEAARAAIDAAGKHGAGAFAIGEATGATPTEVRAILAHLVRDGIAVQMGDLWFSSTLVDQLRGLAVDHLKRASRLSVIEFKEVSGLARKQAILLLEHFDRQGITRREGDARVLR
ncbi:MAG: selenocysteine-specific translation elongation factor [Polyangiaceae bacterium]